MTVSRWKSTESEDQLWLIVERAVGGDRGAFGELYEHFGPLVERMVRSHMRGASEADVEDVVSETWCAVLERIEYFVSEGPGSFEKWLSAWARGKALDHHRRADQISPRPGADLASTQLADTGWGVDDVVIAAEDAAEARQLAARAVTAMEELPARQARVVSWRELDRVRIRDIAADLSITAGAVSALRYRGVRSLRASMSEAVA